MRKPIVFWLWLVYSGMITWQGLLVVHAHSGRVGEQSDFIDGGPTTSSHYEYDTDIENVTDEPPSTTLKAGRNYGSRIRGINNNSPYNANSVNNNYNNVPPSSSASVSNLYNPDAQNNYGATTLNPPSFLRPRPTSSSVISYNPTNYNRVFKRRKNQENSTILTNTSTTTTSTSNDNNINNNYSTLNQSRGVQQQQQEVFTPLSQPTPSQQNQTTNGLNKVIIRKRPRPVTLNDFATTTTNPPVVTKNVENNYTNLNNNDSVSSSTSSSSSFNIPQNNINVSLRSRRVKLTPTVSSNIVPSSTMQNVENSMMAQPVSNVPVSIPKFEYNPSVSIKDGVYRFRYSEPSYSSRRVFTENFGVTHDTYSSDDDDEGEGITTTYAPPPEGTTNPYHINIDGSEEEFTSSLPPIYRQFLDNTQEELLKQQKNQQYENQQQRPITLDEARDQHVRNALNAENKHGSVTVTVTHTVIATTNPTLISLNKTNNNGDGIEGADNRIVGTKLNNNSRRPTSSVKDENSHPNTIPVVADQFNRSRTNHNHSQSQYTTTATTTRGVVMDEDEQLLRPTPALPLYPIQPSTSSIGVQVNQIFKTNSSQRGEDNGFNVSNPSNNSLNVASIAQANSNVPSVTINNSIVKNPSSNGSIDQDGNGDHGHPIIDNASSPNPTSDANNVNNGDGIMPSPTISSKVLSSVFYTKNENPYYTTSSYSYGVTTEYSYYVPHQPDDHHHHHHGDNKHDEDNSQKQQVIRPTTTAYWDSLGDKSIDILKSRFISNASTITASPGEHNNDQELGYSTPEVDTELPPRHNYPYSDHTTPMPVQSHDHSNVHDNEIDDGSESGDDSSSSADDDGVVQTSSKGNKKRKGGSGVSYNENDAALPSVPVFIQVLLDMPANVFCSSVPRFKEMVVKVYAAQWEVTEEQVVVFNEPNCGNLTLRRNVTNRNSTSGSIRYATTTASVIRTVSSTARTVVQRRNITGFTPSTGTSTRPRVKRNDHHNSYHYHSNQENNDVNGTNFSLTHHHPEPTLTLYPVFFYLTDKNGTYNQNLTESFIELWESAKVTTDTMFFDKIKRVEMVTPTQGITGHATTNENSGIIAAITIASIAAVCLFLLGVLLLVMRHRQAATKFAKRCTPVSLDDYSLDNISVYNSFRRKQRNRVSKRSYTNAAFDDPNAPSRPCNAAALAAIVKETVKLEDEFLDLPNINPTMDDIPVGAETKNRYANVIPVPDTRVLLTFQEDVPNSDYINANYVRGPMGTSKGYIITQGPLDSTKNDFWKLVWEQQIRVIMMLTDFSEAGIPKCAEYYPRSETVDSSQLHGDYQITLEKRDIAENCITSYLVIKDMERNLRRDVVHLWYHSWPEKGIPVHPKLTLDFLIKSRKFTKEPTPVLVHCSPGTGRSGTLVACDICIREFETQQNVNIPRTVMKIRQDRAGSVQTKEQYLHIYDVVHCYSSRLGSQLDSI